MGNTQMGFLQTVVMLVMFFSCGNCNTQRFEVAKSVRVEDPASILHRDSRSNHRYRRSVLNSTEQTEVEAAHNRLRRLEGASNMEIMIWDNGLANTAEVWAVNCTWMHSSGGQNLYTTNDPLPINLTDAIQSWYDEKPYYLNYTKSGICYEPKKQCLHYSQVVWGTSQKVGCAYKRCPFLSILNSENALFLVCNYDPPGNIEGQMPYQIGTGCSNCPSRSWWCNEGLCDKRCGSSEPTEQCGCAPVCLNLASIDNASCLCSCPPGWNGVDCNLECKDFNSTCDPKPGSGISGYPPSYCDFNNATSTYVRQLCPKMCKLCKAAVGGSYSTSTKPSLLTVLLVWLCWILLYSFRSV